ncbi:hypothetical protein [Martelella alba]|uniref:Uncharacterized protein n=1 Tax=Martelella alba TaxID=2590451 RepID=A0ABY2SGI0_9HYPH|nr:hypothetical protein [Martelella alba]TKI03545.1 hypothetical protein FCN80_20925 [Martelella alba]
MNSVQIQELDKIIESFSPEENEILQQDAETDLSSWSQGELVSGLSKFASRESLNVVLANYNDALGDAIYEIILRAKRLDKAMEIYYYVPDEVA